MKAIVKKEDVEADHHASRITHNTSLLRNAAWMVWSASLSIANSVVLWALMARWRQAFLLIYKRSMSSTVLGLVHAPVILNASTRWALTGIFKNNSLPRRFLCRPI